MEVELEPNKNKMQRITGNGGENKSGLKSTIIVGYARQPHRSHKAYCCLGNPMAVPALRLLVR